jgi:hypothetical protein
VESVEYRIDDGAWVAAASIGATNQTPFAFEVDTRGLADGNHTVSVRAGAGGVWGIESVQVFEVRGAPAKAPAGVSDGPILFLLAVAVICGPAWVYFARVRKLRAPPQPAAPKDNEPALENF